MAKGLESSLQAAGTDVAAHTRTLKRGLQRRRLVQEEWMAKGLESSLQAAGTDVAAHPRTLKRGLQRRRTMAYHGQTQGISRLGTNPTKVPLPGLGRTISIRMRLALVTS